MSLHYHKIVDGRQVEVYKLNNEITVVYNANSDHDDTLQKASLALIACALPKRNEDTKLQGKIITPKDQLLPLITKYVPPHLRKERSGL